MKHYYPTVLILLGILIFSNHSVHSQRIEVVRANVNGDIVNITYDLISLNQNHLFEIRVYGSHNNYTFPLSLVSGEVGNDIKPGQNKSVVWRAADELGTFSGDVTFQIRGSVTGEVVVEAPPQIEETPVEAIPVETEPAEESIPDLSINNPGAGSSFKIGKSMPLHWNGGKPNEDIKIELFKSNNMLRNVGTSPNNGSLLWTVPKDIKGSDFKIKLFNINTPESAVFSGEFKIKGKTALIIKLLPLFAAGGVAAIFLLGGDGGEGDSSLPVPPDVPPGRG